jgi:hypothetical protein
MTLDHQQEALAARTFHEQVISSNPTMMPSKDPQRTLGPTFRQIPQSLSKVLSKFHPCN